MQAIEARVKWIDLDKSVRSPLENHYIVFCRSLKPLHLVETKHGMVDLYEYM